MLCKAQVCIGHEGAVQGVQRVKKQRLSQCSMVSRIFSSHQNDFHPEHLWETFTKIDAAFFSQKTHSPCIYRLAAALLISIDLTNKNFHILIETTMDNSKDALLFHYILQRRAVSMHVGDESASLCRTDQRPPGRCRKQCLRSIYRPWFRISGMASLPSHAIMRLFSTSMML